MTEPLIQTESSTIDVNAIVNAVAAVTGGTAPLHEPEIAGNEWAYVKDCLDSGWVSSVGAYVDRFEEMLADYTGAAHVVATVNGTAALHAAMVLAGVEAGDEVLAPALTFVAPVNSISYCGATPHFIDSDPRTFGLDPVVMDAHLQGVAEVRDDICVNRTTGRRIRAVVCVHIFGHAAALDELKAVCERWSLTLIEDAAESLGTFYKGVHTGNHGRLSTLSFNGNKIATTGGGGAIMMNCPELATQAKHITTTAKLPHAWAFNHDQVGFNYRLPNVNAALGCAQIERLDGFLSRKRALAKRYESAFAHIDGLEFVSAPPESVSNFWLNSVILNPQHESRRDDILAALNEAGLMCRPAWTPMHLLDMFQESPRSQLTTAENLARRAICLPSSPNLAPDLN